MAAHAIQTGGRCSLKTETCHKNANGDQCLKKAKYFVLACKSFVVCCSTLLKQRSLSLQLEPDNVVSLPSSIGTILHLMASVLNSNFFVMRLCKQQNTVHMISSVLLQTLRKSNWKTTDMRSCTLYASFGTRDSPGFFKKNLLRFLSFSLKPVAGRRLWSCGKFSCRTTQQTSLLIRKVAVEYTYVHTCSYSTGVFG